MAFNRSPKVAAARALAHQFDADEAIVLLLNRRTGMLEYASYGTSKELCDDAKELADVAYEAIQEHLEIHLA